ncbi:baculoviral IAP repeat-containing protein 5 [Mytilus galloprovincialis]|uniref:Baculoviral IAP repeat-containing protein 5 n=1 Tax=Mytilus galloprovincialis TaxID=29158 RepID=A0A8B6BYK6_MYTGA|nr:baculoviral IAP repeat-containing protein 5 [Mytilus galloprovincialis]
MSSFNFSKDEFYRRLSLGITVERCYDLEYARLLSFSNCPSNFLPNFSYIKLAAAGFYFDSGQCKCYKCGIIWTDNHSNWDLIEVHRQLSPFCQFACTGIREEIRSANVNCPSIGIRRSTDVESLHEPISEETRTKGRPGTSLRSSSLLDTGYSSLATSIPIQEEGQSSHMQICSNAGESHKDFRYTNYCVRLASFGNWPKTQTPADLASAGFFYTGTGDVVKCFSCGKRIYQWEPYEIPWMEHKKHSPNCDFVKTNMPNRLRNRETHNLLTEQPSQNSEENGAIASPTDDVVTEFDNVSSRNFSTQIISYNDIDLYMESPAALAVLHTESATPNINQHVRETLTALYHNKECKPSAVQIVGVVWLLQDRDEKIQDRDKKIQDLKEHTQSLESAAANRSVLTKCGICLTEERTMVCCPCGHVICCEACSDKLIRLHRNPRCPLCRQAVDRFMKTFWA